MATIVIPASIRRLMELLQNNHFEAFLVGGSVRDALIGRSSKDWDIATNATPEQVMTVFSSQIAHLAGVKFGMVAVFDEQKHIIEITTFRAEAAYQDGRRPTQLGWSKTAKEDAERRDFTINALYADSEGTVRDFFTGLSDLSNKIIRTVGNPYERFKEDYLRMLRAIRFACTFNFAIEKQTFEAITALSKNITRISMERITAELNETMKYSAKRGLELLQQTGLLHMLLPEVLPLIGFDQRHPKHAFDVYTHTLHAVDYANKHGSLNATWAALFHDLGKPATMTIDEQGIGHFYRHNNASAELATSIMERLKFSNAARKHITNLVNWHLMPEELVSNKSLKRWYRNISRPYTSKDDEPYLECIVDDLILLLQADEYGKQASITTKIEKLQHLAVRMKKILENSAIRHIESVLNGHELMELGYHGKQIGKVKQTLIDWQLGLDYAPSKSEALKFLKETHSKE